VCVTHMCEAWRIYTPVVTCWCSARLDSVSECVCVCAWVCVCVCHVYVRVMAHVHPSRDTLVQWVKGWYVRECVRHTYVRFTSHVHTSLGFRCANWIVFVCVCVCVCVSHMYESCHMYTPVVTRWCSARSASFRSMSMACVFHSSLGIRALGLLFGVWV